jgi:proline iminopeptidase
MIKIFSLSALFLLATLLTSAQQRDSSYYRKINDPATSFVQLKEGYKIFSQNWGTGKIKILFLHGGPGNSHEYFEIFKEQLPLDKYSLYVYNQLGSYYSDQPADTTLWNIPRFVNEVEQVRAFYHLDKFYLAGHSWGGLLAMEYALKYPGRLKGLIISNKSYSQKKLIDTRTALTIKTAKELNASEKTIEEIKNNKRISDTSEDKKINIAFSRQHLVRLDVLPDAMMRNQKHLIRKYGKYFHDRDSWNILDRLQQIKTPTLIIGAKNDFVSQTDLKEMKSRIKDSELYMCPNGGHFDFWDDTTNYFKAFTAFINKIENDPYSTRKININLNKKRIG